MRIPSYMLKQNVSVTPYTGSGAYGDKYGAAYTLRCRIEPRNQLVRASDGSETVASAKMYCFPDAEISVQDIVTWNGREFDVIDVMDEAGPNGQIHHKEVTLR